MKKTLSFVYILIAAALWGCIGLFYDHLAVLGYSPFQVVFLRVLTASVLMGIYILIRNVLLFRIRFRDLWMFVGTGIASLAFFNYCYFSAMEELSPSVAAVLLYTAPAFVMVMSLFLFGENMTVQKMIALLMTLLGCVLVIGMLTQAKVTMLGVLFGLGSGIGYALYTIFGVYALRRYRTETITFYTFVFATISVLPFCDLLSMITNMLAAPVKTVSGSLGIGFLAAFLPYLLYTKGLSGVTPGQASVIATLEPVVATVIGVTLLGDTLTVSKICGILCIIGAIVLLSLPTLFSKK